MPDPKRRGQTKPCACGRRTIDPRAQRCILCTVELKGGVAPAVAQPQLNAAELLAADRERNRSMAQLRALQEKYKAAQETIERYEREMGVTEALKVGFDTYDIVPVKGTGNNEATAFAICSDWHTASTVGKEVGGLNVFNLDVFGQRTTKLFQKILELTNLMAAGIRIPRLVLALLGDFITNHIHEEFQETNSLPPTFELVTAQNAIASGIQYLLDNSDMEIVCPCHSGNHARTTKTTRFGAENGHSLEYLMYLSLAMQFRNEPRVTFIVPEAPHSYLDVYGTTIRFQHGHMVKYGGGVGGLTIPLNKAIAQWNKGRHADLDVLGHFHQMFDGGNFIVNGSLIGYDSFALSIKASFEAPKQAMFLMDAKRGRTFTWPVLLK